ncbi:MAG: hypothetical protein Q9157_007101 [Trypethelium eluteriae]
MNSTSDFDKEFQKRANRVFGKSSEKDQLQVNGISWKDDNGRSTADVLKVRSLKQRSEIEEIKDLHRERNAVLHLFEITQDRSWTALHISQDLFNDFIKVYSVFDDIWQYVIPLGKKDAETENEFEYPGYTEKRTLRSLDGGDGSNQTSFFESAHVLRRAEKDTRKEKPTPVDSDWIIRQTAVYFQSTGHYKGGAESTFLLVAPSENVKKQLHTLPEPGLENERVISPIEIHRILISDSLKSWMEYIIWLEKWLNDMSDHVGLASDFTTVRTNTTASQDPESNFIKRAEEFNFEDRVRLKHHQDRISDLQVLLPTLLYSVKGIRKQCQDQCRRECKKMGKSCGCEQILELFGKYVKDLAMCRSRTNVLSDKAKSTTQLVSDTVHPGSSRAGIDDNAIVGNQDDGLIDSKYSRIE